jgi:cold shock protein
MPTGTVTWFSEQRGYGFIDDGGGREIFVHRTALEPGRNRLVEGARVEFEVIRGRKGPEAANVIELPRRVD